MQRFASIFGYHREELLTRMIQREVRAPIAVHGPPRRDPLTRRGCRCALLCAAPQCVAPQAGAYCTETAAICVGLGLLEDAKIVSPRED